ncbi:MAG: AI-2E family transporter [Candidatus Dormiibacterota bacterium]
MLTDRQWGLIRALLIPFVILTWIAVIVVAGWALSHVVRVVLLLALAGVVAYAVTPLVNLFNRWMPRVLAIVCAYVIGFAALFGLLGFVGYTASTQIAILVHSLPSYINQAQLLEPRVLALLRPIGVGPAQLAQARNTIIQQAQAAGSEVATSAVSTIQVVLSGIIDAVLALMLSVYLTANGPRIASLLRRTGSGVGYGRRVAGFIKLVNQIVGGYVRGTLTLATLVGVLVGAFMAVLGVPYAILLGVIAFFMEFVPVIGVFISGAICVLLTLGTQGVIKAGIVLVGFVVIHLLEGDLVGPRIMGKAVGIHPAVALVALVAGTDLFGIWGALFGAPLAGLIQAFAIAGWRELRRSELLEGEPPSRRAGGSPPRKQPTAAALVERETLVEPEAEEKAAPSSG